MARFSIVVTTYTEPIEWVHQFPNTTVQTELMYTYIYDNYTKLTDYTIFLQGTISPPILYKVHQYVNHLNLDVGFECIEQNLAGTSFIVAKQNILNRSRTFYHSMVELYQYETYPTILEHFHKIIFDHD